MAADVLETIGRTPLLTLWGISAKLETTNPTGSIKDRMAAYLVKRAEERGELSPGQTILEVTSGNTGISLAMISAIRGYRFIAVMPESMSTERRKMMEVFGAEIILTPGEKDMAGAVEKYQELTDSHPGAWLPKQFESPDNIEAHEKGLGKEILEQTGGEIDAFAAGIGTGGTLIGVAKALEGTGARIIGVEPAESAVLSGGKPGIHRIQGIGEGFIPKLVADNMEYIDEVIAVKSQDAIAMSRRLAREHGVLAGTSSGANMLAARSLKGYRNIVTVLPDRGERYFSAYGSR